MRGLFTMVFVAFMTVFASCMPQAVIATTPEAAAVAVGNSGYFWIGGVQSSQSCNMLDFTDDLVLSYDGSNCSITVDTGNCQWISIQGQPGQFGCRCPGTVTGVSGSDCAGITSGTGWSR
jgi:hypothetical protein